MPSVSPHLGSITPQWRANPQSIIERKPVGVVAGGKGHEYEYEPKTSLWFTDNETVVATIVTREGEGKPKLSRHDSSGESLPLHLRAVFFDATSGKVKATPDWPVQSRAASIVAAHDGKIVAQTGSELILYSADLRELKRLKLPSLDGSGWGAQFRLSGHPSPTAKKILFTTGAAPTATWIWVDTDSLQVLRSWSGGNTGRITISDSKIATTTCPTRSDNCDPRIVVSEPGAGWQTLVRIADPRHRPYTQFVDDDLVFLLVRSPTGLVATLVRIGGKEILTENISRSCEWGGIYPSSSGQRVVVPSCKLKGHIEALDMGGYDELEKILVYDAPFRGQSYTLEVKGAKIKERTLLAVSPDGSKLAILSKESLYCFQLPH